MSFLFTPLSLEREREESDKQKVYYIVKYNILYKYQILMMYATK